MGQRKIASYMLLGILKKWFDILVNTHFALSCWELDEEDDATLMCMLNMKLQAGDS